MIVVLEEFKLAFKYLFSGLSIGSWYTLLFNVGGIIHEYILTWYKGCLLILFVMSHNSLQFAIFISFECEQYVNNENNIAINLFINYIIQKLF